MAKHKIPLAIIYDFDGTLAPGNMQERTFIPEIGKTPQEFWTEAKDRARSSHGDEALLYMGLMLECAGSAHVSVRSEDFRQYGSQLELLEGLNDYDIDGTTTNWFKDINDYARGSGVAVDHYVISSGIAEMVEGCSISQYLKKVYASRFYYDHHGVAKWPALCVNYTNKTQFLFRINKGTLDEFDHDVINKFVPDKDRPVPFTNMIYIGDGDTDVPCFRLVKQLGGFSVAVYLPNKRRARARPQRLLSEGRVQFMAPANYRRGGHLDKIVKNIIDKLQSDDFLSSLEGEH